MPGQTMLHAAGAGGMSMLKRALPARLLRPLEQRIGHEFLSRDLLREALVHSSYLNEHQDPQLRSNERLEFLGDAVLGAFAARELYDSFPDADEGWLTQARSQIVRNQALAVLGEELALGDLLLMGAGVENQDARRRPLVLARTLEAVIGAVWLDGGVFAAQMLIRQLIRPALSDLSAVGIRQDPKSLLQEHVQGERGATPRYETIHTSGPVHHRHFEVEVRIDGEAVAIGFGMSKKSAEIAAARQALERLGADHLLQAAIEEPG